MSIENEWLDFLNSHIIPKTKETISVKTIIPMDNDSTSIRIENTPPICDNIYISTKTKVLYLNQAIDIHRIFWLIPVIEYWRPVEGVVKKQMKVVSKNKEEYDSYREKLEGIYYYKEHIIKQIDNPTARRLKFKDERKITVGISRKDIMNTRGKVKNAFYNCFAIIFRFMFEGEFCEIHVKIFNTGKLEIPGILNMQLLDIVKCLILNAINPHIDKENPVEFIDMNIDDNVLINSNFNCGYYINRDRLHEIMRSPKYNIETSYDPCTYPGIKCKFYFNHEIGFDMELQKGHILEEDRGMKMSELIDNNKYSQISFMIFQTGSCLIVGNCTEKILLFVFEFIKQILYTEYGNICAKTNTYIPKVKKIKQRKKMIYVSRI